METQTLKCPTCSRPVVTGATAHLRCQEVPEAVTVNGWPNGSRQLSCLGCDRVFASDSKAQRLCHACRSR